MSQTESDRKPAAHFKRMAKSIVSPGDSRTHTPEALPAAADPGETRGNHSGSDRSKTHLSAGHLLGNARVSTGSQDLDRQRDALTAAGCSRIFEDTVSGTRRSATDGASRTCSTTRDLGDRLVAAELSRLGRRASDLVRLVEDLDVDGVGLVILNLSIDTATPSGRLIVTILAAVAQMERDVLVERTKVGPAAARRRGRVGGRPRSLTNDHVALARDLIAAGNSAAEVARLLGGICSERTIRRYATDGVA